MVEEIWKDIPGYEGLYQISSQGRVKRLPLGKQWPSRRTHNNIRKPKMKGGYLSINLSKDNEVKCFLVHRLVAMVFIPNLNNLPCVNHIDGNRNNNTPENLMVLCRSCHMKEHSEKGVCKICGKPAKGHGYCNKHLLRLKKYGDANHIPWSQYKEKASKGPVLQYTQDGVLVAEYKDLRTAERKTQFARSSIASACNGNRKTLNGYIWKYGN